MWTIMKADGSWLVWVYITMPCTVYIISESVLHVNLVTQGEWCRREVGK